MCLGWFRYRSYSEPKEGWLWSRDICTGYTIPAEFNDIPHKRGIVSMARSSHPDSAGSQFFIVVKDANFLDGKYTVFGEVIEGMDVVDKIVSQPRHQTRELRDQPAEKMIMESVRIEGS